MTEQLQNQMQDNMRPLVTVAMPVYNAGNYLRLAVLSIVKQTFTDWEMLIIDDGSTDNALDSIADIQDYRIRIIKDGVNKGLAARLNEAIDLARGQYLARMDQDDVSYPERFERQVQALQMDPELDLVAVRGITISMHNMQTGYLPYSIKHEEITATPWKSFNMPHPTWMGKLSWFKKYHYKVPQSYYSEDYELLLRSYKNSKFACLPEILFEYRIKHKIIWNNQFKARKAVLKLQALHFYNQREYLFIALSFSVFFLRIILDFSKIVNQSLRNT